MPAAIERSAATPDIATPGRAGPAQGWDRALGAEADAPKAKAATKPGNPEKAVKADAAGIEAMRVIPRLAEPQNRTKGLVIPADLAPSINRTLDRAQTGVTSLPQSTDVGTVPDRTDPKRPTGRNTTITAPVAADSPIVPGGKVTSRFFNTDRGAPGQLDIRAVDAKGQGTATLRVNAAANTATGVVRLGQDDGKAGGTAVVNATVSTTNPSATALQGTSYQGDLGVRVRLDNPGQGTTAAGKPGATGNRQEVFYGAGKVLTNVSSPQRDVEAGVFRAESRTPGTLSRSETLGGFVRAGTIKGGGEVPVTGTASIEAGYQSGRTGAGARADGVAVTGSANILIGKEGGVQGGIQPFVTVTPGQPTAGGVFGFISIPLGR